MANLITLSRLVLLLVVVALAYRPVSPIQLWIWPVLSLVFISDGLDGWVARRRGEESLFGALFDIAVDRIVELTLWIVLADLDVIPIWIRSCSWCAAFWWTRSGPARSRLLGAARSRY